MKHGHCTRETTTPEYQAWCDLKYRCNNPSSVKYGSYGGRGISVCERWRNSFEARPRPSPQHSIDRINVDGNYEPGNCRWATKSEQASNRRRRQTLRLHNFHTLRGADGRFTAPAAALQRIGTR
jgi:hypothetical protein